MSEEYQIVKMKISKSIAVYDTPNSFIEEAAFGAFFLHLFVFQNSVVNFNSKQLLDHARKELIGVDKNTVFEISTYCLVATVSDVYVSSEMAMMKKHQIVLRKKSPENEKNDAKMRMLDCIAEDNASDDGSTHEYEDDEDDFFGIVVDDEIIEKKIKKNETCFNLFVFDHRIALHNKYHACIGIRASRSREQHDVDERVVIVR